MDDEEGCPAQCAGEFLSRRASGRPPLATAAASELLSNILGDNEPRLCAHQNGVGQQPSHEHGAEATAPCDRQVMASNGVFT